MFKNLVIVIRFILSMSEKELDAFLANVVLAAKMADNQRLEHLYGDLIGAETIRSLLLEESDTYVSDTF